MSNLPKRLKPVIKDPYLFPLETEPTDIIEAMNLIVEHSENTGFTENLFFHLQKPIHYLCQRLQINEKQAVLLSVVCELGADANVTLSGLSDHFGCSNLNAMTFIKELDDLVTKSFLFKPSAKTYTVKWDILNAFSNNEVYTHEVVKYDSCEALLYDIESLAYEFDGSLFCTDFHNELQFMLNDNMHLKFAKTLSEYGLDRNDQGLLIGACIQLCCHGQYSFDMGDYRRYVDRRYLNTSWRELLRSSHLLIYAGLVEPCCDDGLEDDEMFELTKKAKSELLSEVVSLSDDLRFKDIKDFFPCQEITQKDLYFNEDVKEQYNRLSNLLQQESYLQIHDRLIQNGMRTGFACLFYGGPGTGKTEAALQLARMTGRGIYQVNMANIRSKWVGESEKNVKSIFQQYHSIVSHAEVAPILLLNEADALLGNRFTNINRSVEKMENTMQNIILQEMEQLDGILTDNLDSAFERRFLFKVMFSNPDANARLSIWHDLLPEAKGIKNLKQIVDDYPFSGGQIENIARKCKIEYILEGKTPDFDMLKSFCDEEVLIKTRTHVAGFRNDR